jgi:hypothetical protein
MRCVLCKKALPKRGRSGRKIKAHLDCLHIDEAESTLATGGWINPVTGEKKGTKRWQTLGITTGRTSFSQPNMQNLSTGQARNLAKQIRFAQAYGASPQKIADMLKRKGLPAAADFSVVEQRLANGLNPDTLLSVKPCTTEPTDSESEKKT